MKRNVIIAVVFSCILISCVLLSCRSTQSIRIMSYNIRVGTTDDGENSWERRKPATIAMLQTLNPDVFGIQEAQPFQIDYILTNCSQYKCVGVGREDGIDAGEHMSVFYDTTRIELLDWGTYWLSETPDIPSVGWDARYKRTATWTLLRQRHSHKCFYCVNTHLDNVGAQARYNGLNLISENIQKMNSEDYPIMLIGDFNVTPLDTCLSAISYQMKSARKTAAKRDKIGSFNAFGTYHTSETNLSIDHIYYSGAKKCESFHVDTTKYMEIPYISDHYPIYADIQLK